MITFDGDHWINYEILAGESESTSVDQAKPAEAHKEFSFSTVPISTKASSTGDATSCSVTLSFSLGTTSSGELEAIKMFYPLFVLKSK